MSTENGTEIVDATVVEDCETGTDLIPASPAMLFKTDDPVEVVEQATRAANALKSVVASRGLIANIRGKEHPQVEAWQTLGAMLGVSAVPVGEPRALPWPNPAPAGLKGAQEKGLTFGFVATYRAMKAGMPVGGGSARCVRTESTWSSRDDYALFSMAQTRAISKTLSGPLRFVMALAGYETTPAEEMPREEPPLSAQSPNTGMRVTARPAQQTERMASAKQRGLINARASEKGLPPDSLANIVLAANEGELREFASQSEAEDWLRRALDRLPMRLVNPILEGIEKAPQEATV